MHFGQNRGKSSNTVCGRICVLVLPPHLGQRSQSTFDFSVLIILYHLFTYWDRDESVLSRFSVFGCFLLSYEVTYPPFHRPAPTPERSAEYSRYKPCCSPPVPVAAAVVCPHPYRPASSAPGYGAELPTPA